MPSGPVPAAGMVAVTVLVVVSITVTVSSLRLVT